MIKQPISAGDLVIYHGSKEGYHGKEYIIIGLPQGFERGYVLLTNDPAVEVQYGNYGRILSNVHRDSFTLKVAQYDERYL